MKRFVLIIVPFFLFFLSACSSQAPVQPAITTGTLDTAEAYLRRGDQYSEIKDYVHAIADYSQAIRLKPDYAEAYNNRGLAYSLFGKMDMPKAIADFSTAIQLRPDYPYAYNNRGVAYMASGFPDQALRDINHAIQLQPDFPQAYSNRGNAFYRAGRIDLAMIDFYRARKVPGYLVTILCGLASVVVILIFVAVPLRLRQAMRMRAGGQAVIDKKRQSNKRSNNRIVMTIGRAGQRFSLFALIRHTGRKSGKQYVTPVRLVQYGQKFTIPLTYGECVDWYRNLQAAGEMELQWQGVIYHVGQPERLEITQAANDFPLISRFLFWLDGVPGFVRVTRI